MNIMLESIFPTGIMVVDDFLSLDQIRSIVNFVRLKEAHQNDHTVPKNAYSTFDGTSNIINEITQSAAMCADLENKISFVLNEYATKVLGLAEVKVSNSWAHIQNHGSYIVEHTHPNSKVSGVLYLKSDEGSNNLVFKNPNPYNKIEAPVVHNEFNYGNSTFPAKPGRVLLFPSWLEHGSNHIQNYSTERIIISFNSIYKN